MQTFLRDLIKKIKINNTHKLHRKTAYDNEMKTHPVREETAEIRHRKTTSVKLDFFLSSLKDVFLFFFPFFYGALLIRTNKKYKCGQSECTPNHDV